MMCSTANEQNRTHPSYKYAGLVVAEGVCVPVLSPPLPVSCRLLLFLCLRLTLRLRSMRFTRALSVVHMHYTVLLVGGVVEEREKLGFTQTPVFGERTPVA